MGRAIANLISPEDQILMKIGRQNQKELNPKNLKACDVAIEFSTPDTAFENIQICLQAGIPVVSGTTGWLHRLPEIRELVKKTNGAFFYAANFSIGVNLFFAINEFSAKLMARFPDYKVTMEEQHHIHKLDAPSGTAIRLSQDIIAAQSDIKSWSLDKDAENSLYIKAVREGEIPGTHIIQYTSGEDTIHLKHQAYTRDSFARGALSAARWINVKNGVFGMKDLLTI